MQRDDALKILIKRYLWTVPKCTANGCCNEEEDDCLLTPHAVSTSGVTQCYAAMEGGDVSRWSVWERLPGWRKAVTQDNALWATGVKVDLSYMSIFWPSCSHPATVQTLHISDFDIWLNFDVKTIPIAWKLKDLQKCFLTQKYFSCDPLISKGVAKCAI